MPQACWTKASFFAESNMKAAAAGLRGQEEVEELEQYEHRRSWRTAEQRIEDCHRLEEESARFKRPGR